MKREIIFRGKRKKGTGWVYGDLNQHDIHHGTSILENGCINNAVIKETVGQYTGLKDKEGNKIFEGDIVRWDDMSDGQMWRVAVVEINPDLRFRIIRIKCDFRQSAQEGHVFNFGNFIYKDTENHFEIIGNIHDNAELIK